MSRIEELIKDKCPDGVEFRKLEDCCNILDKKRKPVTKSAREAGEYPYYGANGIQDYVSGYIFDGTFVLVGEDGSVVTSNGTPVVTWAKGKIWVNNHAHIIEAIDSVDLRYLYHFLQTVYVGDLIHGNIPKLNQGDFRQIEIAVPPIEVQQEIVRILDKFTELEAELQAELDARKKQYEHYMFRILLSIENSKEYNLEDVCQIVDCPHTSPQWRDSGIPVIRNYNLVNGKIDIRNMSYVSEEEYIERTKRVVPDENDILFSREAPIGNVGIVPPNFKCCQGQRVVLLRPKTNIVDPVFLTFLLQGPLVKQQIEIVTHKGGTVSNFNISDLKKLKLIIPPLSEQGGAVSVLKKFDDLCNDYENGLPAEIEARRKQYEYYRDTLLSFERLGE